MKLKVFSLLSMFDYLKAYILRAKQLKASILAQTKKQFKMKLALVLFLSIALTLSGLFQKWDYRHLLAKFLLMYGCFPIITPIQAFII